MLIGLFGSIYASRLFATVWLPMALCGALAVCLWYVPIPAKTKFLLWGALSAGAILLWLISEPEVSFYDHRFLFYIAAGLFGIWMFCVGTLVRGWTVSDAQKSVYGWALALVLMSCLIAFFSSPSGSSGGMISAAMHFFGLSREHAETLVFYVRKTIHLSFYGLLGLAAFRWSLAAGFDRRKAIMWALAFALAHASYDESRQSFFADRTGSFWDVLLDMAGATAFVWIASVRWEKRERVRALPN